MLGAQGSSSSAPPLMSEEVLNVRFRKLARKDRVGVLLHGKHGPPKVKEIKQDGLGAETDLKVGDTVLKVNGEPVNDHAEATRIVRQAVGEIKLTVARPAAVRRSDGLLCGCCGRKPPLLLEH